MDFEKRTAVQTDADSQLRRAKTRNWVLRILMGATALALVGSLIYQGDPPDDFVHTHHAFRIYAPMEAGPSYIDFPIFNYQERHSFVHMHEDDPHLGPRSNELFHVHKAGFTLGDFLGSLGITIEPGALKLDDPESSRRAVHHGESWRDNSTHHWRFYVQSLNESWQRILEPDVAGSVDYGAHQFGKGERILLTYVPRALADDDPLLEDQKSSVAPDLWRWPQDGPGDKITPGR